MKFKRMISLLLSMIMIAALLPVTALAEPEDNGKTGESAAAEAGAGTEQEPEQKEETAPETEEPPKEQETAKEGQETGSKEPEMPAVESKKTPMLVVTGGQYEYDGKTHKVSAKVENGTGYTIEYSTDDKKWSSSAIGRKDTGKTTVKVRATKSGAETLTSEATIEIVVQEEQIVTIVNCNSGVNVRKGAGSKTAKVGTASKGAKYKLLAVEGSWYKIRYKSDVTGYVFVDYVKLGKGTPSQDEPEPEPSGSDKIVTIVNCKAGCNVRKGGSTSYAKIGIAPKGAKYQYLGKSGNYYKIQYTSSQTGYVHKNYTKVSGGSVTPDPDDPPASGQIVTIINCKLNCNIRQSASQSSKKIGTAPRDKQYQYLGKSGNYYKIQYTASKVGYVHVNYAKVGKGSVTPDPDSKDPNQGTIVNCKSMVNVRAEASSSSKLLGTVKLGSKVTVIKTVGNWTKIKYNGGEAYVFSKYVKIG